jgi:hypothetical protein
LPDISASLTLQARGRAPDGGGMSGLFSPCTLDAVALPDRIVVGPMAHQVITPDRMLL